MTSAADMGERQSGTARLADIASALRSDGRFADRQVTLPHPLLLQIRDGQRIVLLAPAAAWDQAREIFKPFAGHFAEVRAALVLLGHPGKRGLDEAIHRGLSAIVSTRPNVNELYVAIHNAIELLDARRRSKARGEWVTRYRYEIGEFFEIARAITKEREIDKLLELILEKARFITGADAGSIYVVEGEAPEVARRVLHFKLAQNDSISFPASEFTLPISERSMAGYVALNSCSLNIPDAYRLPPDAPYGFDRSFDERVGYRSKSMLCTPLLSRRGDIIGVLQLINRKVDPKAKLINLDEDLEGVVPFDKRSEDLLSTVASLAGIALENAFLYAENERMLEGFVRASVEAIEQRDPTTSGHSRRVAEVTVELARAVEREETGIYKAVTWGEDDLKELEYASLLHDFGKIGVREQVLVKAKKLYPHDLELIRARFALALRSLEVEILNRKVALARGSQSGDSSLAEALDAEFEDRRHKLEGAWKIIVDANEPKVLSGGDFAMLETIARQTYVDERGAEHPLLEPGEIECLSVPRGSLTSAEFDEIRLHVTHTQEFLSTIPWGRKFRRVAQIAGAHHERLDGTGYPKRLHSSEIPLQSKIMTISDIFDALTAADRPYKKAVPLARALDILNMEVKQGHVDGELVRILVASKTWEILADPPK